MCMNSIFTQLQVCLCMCVWRIKVSGILNKGHGSWLTKGHGSWLTEGHGSWLTKGHGSWLTEGHGSWLTEGHGSWLTASLRILVFVSLRDTMCVWVWTQNTCTYANTTYINAYKYAWVYVYVYNMHICDCTIYMHEGCICIILLSDQGFGVSTDPTGQSGLKCV